MQGFLAQSFLDVVIDGLSAFLQELAPIRETLWWVVLWLLPIVGLCSVVYALLHLPLRRRERAGVFLDLIETGLRRGFGPEQTLQNCAECHDPALGTQFEWVAEEVRAGRPLGEVLEEYPRFLPPGIAATLRTGLELGDLAHVLPACRRQLKDGISQTRGAVNYLVVMLFMVVPLFPAFLMLLMVWVLPRFREIYYEMLPGVPLPAAWTWGLLVKLAYVQVAVMFLLQVAAFFYVVGPRAKGWFGRRIRLLADALSWRLPWRRNRLQRDFSAMLALLLDGGMAEAEAVKRAASSTANLVLQRRAADVCATLAGGVPLVEAVRGLDDSGELHWRLSNAAHAGKGFLAALAGWIEALDARAFQQEQAAAHLLTSALVLFNGLMVGLLAVSVFLLLTTIIQEGTLW